MTFELWDKKNVNKGIFWKTLFCLYSDTKEIYPQIAPIYAIKTSPRPLPYTKMQDDFPVDNFSARLHRAPHSLHELLFSYFMNPQNISILL